MSYSRWCGLTAAVLAASVLIGCGGGGDKGASPTTKGGDTKSTGGATKSGGKLEAIDAKETAVLKGRVTYDGAPPAPADLKGQIEGNDDKDHCKKDESGKSVTDLTWVVSKDGGVANVAVWVLPGDGTYFKLPDGLA